MIGICLTILWGDEEQSPHQTVQISPNGDGILISTQEGEIVVDFHEIHSLIDSLGIARGRAKFLQKIKPH